MKTHSILISISAFFLMFGVASAQNTDHENFRIEATVGAWWLHPSGNVLSNGTQVDFRNDLGISETKVHPFVRLAFKPTRRNRIIFEAIPYRLDGTHTLTRSFTFGGTTYAVQEPISSNAHVNYLFGGYQFDVVSGKAGHAGLLTGVGYFDGSATAVSETRGLSGVQSAKLPFPIIGGEFRGFPAPNAGFNISGEIKGAPLGSYGHYIHGAVNAGWNLGSHVTIQGGYSILNADLHQRDGSRGFKLDFRGPVASIQLRK